MWRGKQRERASKSEKRERNHYPAPFRGMGGEKNKKRARGREIWADSWVRAIEWVSPIEPCTEGCQLANPLSCAVLPFSPFSPYHFLFLLCTEAECLSCPAAAAAAPVGSLLTHCLRFIFRINACDVRAASSRWCLFTTHQRHILKYIFVSSPF